MADRSPIDIARDLERESKFESWGSSRPLLAEAAEALRDLALKLRLAEAPEDDEPLTVAEIEAIKESEADLQAGRFTVVQP